MASNTARIAEHISGDKLYQIRARQALPLLVRQALAGEPIFYSDLADELGMPNARNLNYPLGSIGRTMERLSKEWEEDVPPIQCLVVNRHTFLPGEGIGWFLIKEQDFASLSPNQKRRIVKAELEKIFSYNRWPDVLRTLSLPPAKSKVKEAIEAATKWRGGAESEDHKRLKNYIAKNPYLLGLPLGSAQGEIEYRLPSGDALDVSFHSGRLWRAAEVKSAKSGTGDITRGLFQCVKYTAVMEAMQAVSGRSKAARAVLVLEGVLPPELVPLKNMLGVDVLENVKPK